MNHFSRRKKSGVTRGYIGASRVGEERSGCEYCQRGGGLMRRGQLRPTERLKEGKEEEDCRFPKKNCKLSFRLSSRKLGPLRVNLKCGQANSDVNFCKSHGRGRGRGRM